MNGKGNDADGGGEQRLGEDDGTVVLVSRDYLVGAIGRTADALLRAGDAGLEARRLVTAGAGVSALEELIEEAKDLRGILDGLIGALQRVVIDETPKP